MMQYSETLLDHFHHPRNAGELDHPDAVAEGENPVCGDKVHIEMRIRSDVITEMRWSATGCPPTIAAVSAASLLLEGCDLREARSLDRDALATALGGIPARKAHVLSLVITTVTRALDTFAGDPQS
jgi:nitrogen fixation protein NifU and related proteins